MMALFFFLCVLASPDECDGGVVWARSCAVAEAYLHAGLRPGQVLHVLRCEPA